jgi:hypothetical protein
MLQLLSLRGINEGNQQGMREYYLLMFAKMLLFELIQHLFDQAIYVDAGSVEE